MIRLFHQQLQLGKADHLLLTSALSTLTHLDPFQATGSGELGFLWITEILNSGYPEQWRERMAGEVVKSLGKHFFRKDPMDSTDLQPAWIPPLLGFLSLGEKLDTSKSSGFLALRILATSPGSADFGPMILPILHSTLLPTHPLQARHLALNIFLEFMPGWFSSQMEDIPTMDLERLVQAVGDPFQFPGLPPQDGKPVDPPNYDPMRATAVLIKFASSDLWRNHLRRSNFTSFEEMVSTWDGKKTALKCMINMETDTPSEFLRTAAKISTAIRRLEELQCSNAVEVVIMWAWTVGVVNPVDHDGWEFIESDTLRFYQIRGVEGMVALKRHISDADTSPWRFWILAKNYRAILPEARHFVERPVLKLLPETVSTQLAYLRLSQTCQSRRLYQLLGYDPVTWGEAVSAVGVDKTMPVSLRRSVLIPASFADWACDYP